MSHFRLADSSDRAANLGGPISTTVAWQGSSSPPACVVLEQDCFVSWKGDSGVTGNCFNPLGGSAISLTPAGQSWSYTLYTVINNPGTTIPVPDCAPTAGIVVPLSVQGTIGCQYSVSVYPVSVNLNGTTPDASGQQNILIGQQCTSSLVGLPSTPSGTTFAYSWTVGGSTFQDWQPTTPTYYMGGSGPLSQPTAQWYWNQDKGPETVSGTVTVTPPSNLGSSFTVTLSKQANVEVPGWTAFGVGGTMQVNSAYPGGKGTNDYWLYAGSAGSPERGGMNWTATVTSPDTTLFGAGNLVLTQLVTNGMSYTAGSSTHYWSLNGQQGLDTSFNYPWYTYPPNSPNYFAYDAPGFSLTDGTVATSGTVNDQFDDYLMYQPPLPPGTNPTVCWVPLATFHWSTNGSATIPATGNWADFGSGSVGSITPSGSSVKFTPSHSFPAWTQNSGDYAGGHF